MFSVEFLNLIVRYVENDGKPTPEFQRLWQALAERALLVEDAVERLDLIEPQVATNTSDIADIKGRFNLLLDWVTYLDTKVTPGYSGPKPSPF